MRPDISLSAKETSPRESRKERQDGLAGLLGFFLLQCRLNRFFYHHRNVLDLSLPVDLNL